jgi:thioredoxin-like negative regulator of GroEL
VYNINISTQQAQDYSIIGYHKQANSIYNELEKKYFVTEQVKMDLISNLYTLNKLDEARQKINELKKDYTYNELYSISAKLYMEQNDTLNAEKDFLTASYIAPNRMLKRYDLALFYLQTKDTTKALYWANSILIMPIKVPSNTTENTLNKTKTLLNSLTFNKK